MMSGTSETMRQTKMYHFLGDCYEWSIYKTYVILHMCVCMYVCEHKIFSRTHFEHIFAQDKTKSRHEMSESRTRVCNENAHKFVFKENYLNLS